MRMFVLPLVLLVTACAMVGFKVAEVHDGCHAEHQKFIAVVECIEAKTSELAKGRDGDLIRLYLAEAGLLSLKVQYGALSGRAAWYELESALAFLQRQSYARDDLRARRASKALQDAGAAMQRAAPPPPHYAPRAPRLWYPPRTLNCVTSHVGWRYNQLTCR